MIELAKRQRLSRTGPEEKSVEQDRVKSKGWGRTRQKRKLEEDRTEDGCEQEKRKGWSWIRLMRKRWGSNRLEKNGWSRRGLKWKTADQDMI